MEPELGPAPLVLGSARPMARRETFEIAPFHPGFEDGVDGVVSLVWGVMSSEPRDRSEMFSLTPGRNCVNFCEPRRGECGWELPVRGVGGMMVGQRGHTPCPHSSCEAQQTWELQVNASQGMRRCLVVF